MSAIKTWGALFEEYAAYCWVIFWLSPHQMSEAGSAQSKSYMQLMYWIFVNGILYWGDGLRGVMAKILAYGLEVSDFELQSPYHSDLSTNTLEKDINPLILTVMG